ncbi:MAG: acyl-CoA dehydrogenase family protein, partial [Pseudoclavibacter sp.]
MTTTSPTMYSVSKVRGDGPNAARSVPEALEKIEELRPFIAERAAEGERRRNVTPEVIDALTEAGVFRASVPESYGGYTAGVLDRFNMSRAVARADGGAGWVTAIMLGNNWILGLFPKQAQDDVFRADPDARVTAIIAVDGRADKVDGGYRVSGRWGYNSGVAYTSWVLVAAAVHDENGDFVDTAQLMVPISEVIVEDTWHVAGLRSSGSNTIIAEDLFVPEYRVLHHGPTVSGGNASDGDATYRTAFVASLS